ncbi:MAG: delta-aminolevulinic acid dehydratase [Candidatus Methanofastidiosum methylothiophilum]|uniref:Delta-aminolevulinic acid dehydratase n=1 Tax=Candidatus Methanofastidiosum methylothiophilum TaxID=1705564 RepID=A0A150JMK0_9EURY|nr:MAG: delta-aminolevulinic acid dehydratase [Candidatus Methanofastidiosum methylthiophilus]OQC52263.1 MAG: delta-aminolevulinic acid dehydratase [Euryarchaeota archaeon ADurb.Bin023]HNV93626.1 porphobilinogen synthase [Methanofastidiosum sp.]KYC57618.1 MAG: delta-aminolevulinic acid dehydratase [Candidatus Methanofastidiosum methylthiophilus]KYC58493.1 MAG: delta-aminolevulinic acid dehydratase [Candidatus Methanofastidiosum methylthiophilus]
MRRLRKNEKLRELLKEYNVTSKDLIYPIFVHEKNKVEEIQSMPGQFRYPISKLKEITKKVEDLGIPGILLFGMPEKKDELGSESFNEKGVVQKAIRTIKENTNLLVITDICLCQYTSHGHCGVVCDGIIKNDDTLNLLSRIALSHAKAGADIVAPSDMMDGRVNAIRSELDKNSFEDILIMSYAAKFLSSFYGPFREAAHSAPTFGDRRTYQMDPANILEALREVELDIQEGADIIMVKPALAYLDVIFRVKEKFEMPTAAYNVSGEYSMVKAASKMGWIDEKKVIDELLLAIKRAGADFIISYFALDYASL